MIKKVWLLSMALCLLIQGGYAKKTENCINLGNTPWKFTKVIRQDKNLAEETGVSYGTQKIPVVSDGNIKTEWKADGKEPVGEWTVDLQKQQPVDVVKLWFGNDKTRFAAAKLEISDDNKEWKKVYDKNDGTCVLHKEGDFVKMERTGTVGYAEVVTNTYLQIPVRENVRYIRISGLKCMTEDKKESTASLSELVVTPMNESGNNADEPMTRLAFDDSGWQEVGIPHSFNELDTYLNGSTGERCWRGEVWYRKKIFADAADKGKEMLLEFKGVNIGTTVYINGTPIEGNTAVKQPSVVTHVGSSLAFVINITPYLRWGEENQIAVKVSNAKDSFFTWPGFGGNEGFSQAMGGIVCPVYLHKKSKVHIPFNSYAPMNKWGTYFGTVSATKEKAVVRFQVNVENMEATPQEVELRTYLKDDRGKNVLSLTDRKQVEAGQTALFDRTETVTNPTLWYPIGCSGTPYLYTVKNEVYVNGKLVDEKSQLWGIRQITWDKDYCYVNGEKCILRGFGKRNNYPGLASALPESFQWWDIELIARCGGNTLRVGHQPPYEEAIKACDMYGVLMILNSGDDEWALKNEPTLTYKWERDRDVMVAYRSHPCVAVWESNNGLPGDGERYWPSYTKKMVDQWDYIQPRLVMHRDGFPEKWNREDPIVIGYTNWYWKENGYPSLNAEVYGTNWEGRPSWCISRFDYDNEKAFSMYYVDNYFHDLDNKACGWIDWMLAETYGEGYTIYLNGMRNQKSLGSCAMDGNRFPKLKYRIYEKALWVPYEQRPGVALQSHWNYSGIQNVDAWSNCPYVELFINGKSHGIVEPEKRTRRCTWKGINWEPGTVRAVGLDERKRPICEEEIASAGEPYALEVTIEKFTPKPDGEKFHLRANASDAFVATVKVVDKDGNWCPRADNLLNFEVEGEGVYKGSYNFYVKEGKPLEYHAPGDSELQAEGGLMRVAVRTTFKPGKIKVKVTSDGLQAGEATVKSGKI